MGCLWFGLAGVGLVFALLWLLVFAVVEPVFTLLFVVAVVLLVRRLVRLVTAWAHGR